MAVSAEPEEAVLVQTDDDECWVWNPNIVTDGKDYQKICVHWTKHRFCTHVVRDCLTADRRSGSSGQFESFRSKRSKDDNSLLGRRGSVDRGRSGYEKHHSWSPDVYGANLDNFRPVTLTVSSFFKQVSGCCCGTWEDVGTSFRVMFWFACEMLGEEWSQGCMF